MGSAAGQFSTAQQLRTSGQRLLTVQRHGVTYGQRQQEEQHACGSNRAAEVEQEPPVARHGDIRAAQDSQVGGDEQKTNSKQARV